jgi:hypothetical protein
MAEKKFRWWLVAIPVLLLVLVGVLLFQFRPGIQVTIQNTGATAMRSVVLHVTGVSYEIGDIPPGASAVARVNPTGESGLEIEFTDSEGKVQRLNAGGYFESGYRGTIRVSIKDGTIEKNEQDIKLW